MIARPQDQGATIAHIQAGYLIARLGGQHQLAAAATYVAVSLLIQHRTAIVVAV
ncbi:hypothetical protein D3C72_1794240 [compost metagenome]